MENTGISAQGLKSIDVYRTSRICFSLSFRGCPGRDRMVVGFTTTCTYAISDEVVTLNTFMARCTEVVTLNTFMARCTQYNIM